MSYSLRLVHPRAGEGAYAISCLSLNKDLADRLAADPEQIAFELAGGELIFPFVSAVLKVTQIEAWRNFDY